MRILKFSFLVLLLIPSIGIFAWGDKGHKVIAQFSMNLLPYQIKITNDMKASIIEHSVDPDSRKKDDKSEGPKHFIDIDSFKEFLDGQIITSRDSLTKLYGGDAIIENGILPWATVDTFQKLVEAFKSKNKKEIILYMSDLAHYVGDGHQPQHATINYNGALTGQKGIHMRYESGMIDVNLEQIKNSFTKQTPYYVKNVLEYVFNYILESNSYLEVILSADKYASKKTNGNFNNDYYRLFWFRTKYVTVNQFNSAGLSLASLIYTAWKDAGKPDLGK